MGKNNLLNAAAAFGVGYMGGRKDKRDQDKVDRQRQFYMDMAKEQNARQATAAQQDAEEHESRMTGLNWAQIERERLDDARKQWEANHPGVNYDTDLLDMEWRNKKATAEDMELQLEMNRLRSEKLPMTLDLAERTAKRADELAGMDLDAAKENKAFVDSLEDSIGVPRGSTRARNEWIGMAGVISKDDPKFSKLRTLYDEGKLPEVAKQMDDAIAAYLATLPTDGYGKPDISAATPEEREALQAYRTKRLQIGAQISGDPALQGLFGMQSKSQLTPPPKATKKHYPGFLTSVARLTDPDMRAQRAQQRRADMDSQIEVTMPNNQTMTMGTKQANTFLDKGAQFLGVKPVKSGSINPQGFQVAPPVPEDVLELMARIKTPRSAPTPMTQPPAPPMPPQPPMPPNPFPQMMGWNQGAPQRPFEQGGKPAAAPATDYSEQISKYGQQYSVPPHLLRAVIDAESAGNPNAVSKAGAQGLMQLMPDTAAELGVTDPMDPEQNIAGGTKYLSQMLKMFAGDLPLALAAYNAGPGTVRKYNGIPPFPETQQYVKKVTGLATKYGGGF